MEPKVIEGLKIQAIREKRTVSELLQELAEKYLKTADPLRKALDTIK